MSPLAPPADRHDTAIRERLQHALGDRCVLEAEIGRGGMGRVYKAHDAKHGREVAIKVLPPELATAVAAERFVLEIRTAAQLVHPNILGLIDSGDADGVLYYIMPLVQGESLRERLERQPRLPLDEAVRIACEVASALGHAHQHGVVHRDIKPENVLLVEGPHAIVTDFGLALALLRSAGGKLTLSRHVVGTVYYMSPEQAGSGEQVDGRSDIYSLGCMLYEMLVGRPPYDGDSELVILARHANAPLPGLPGIPAAIERVVHRAMAKSPAERHQTAAEFERDLGEAAASVRRGRIARLLEALVRPRRPTWRGALVGAGGTLVGLAMLGGLAVAVPPAAARLAFRRGQEAVNDWNLAAADSAFSRAIARDGELAPAYLWLAQVRGWESDDPEQWRALAETAVARQARLSPRDRTLAAALRDMAYGRFPDACARYRALAGASPRDFAATYGLGECVRRDSAVVRDPGSPSGWRFRGSRFQAVRAYRDAFEMLPSIHKAYRGTAFERVRGILLTSTSARVIGRAMPPDTTRFRAAPGWQGDSLLLVPWPIAVERASPERVVSPSAMEAVDHQRRMFRDIAQAWRRAFPDDVEPREAMAVALELLGDSSALDTLRAARGVATEDAQRLRLGAEEVWLRVKFALPDDSAGLAAARALGDSLLRRATSATGPAAARLAPIAVLTGRVQLAAELARRASDGSDDRVTTRTAATARVLLACAALGAPVDSMRALEARITSDVRTMIAPSQQQEMLAALLGQAAGLAFPVVRLTSLPSLIEAGNQLLEAEGALATGDSARARRVLDSMARVRATRRAADLTMDVTYPAAWTLFALGDTHAAIGWLDPVLSATPLQPPEVVSKVSNAGGLLRGLALRAELAAATGDTAGARRWARPVAILWANADPPLRPIAQRLASLVAAAPPSSSRAH